jgi:hypothetical protein
MVLVTSYRKKTFINLLLKLGAIRTPTQAFLTRQQKGSNHPTPAAELATHGIFCRSFNPSSTWSRESVMD